jgi:hypothetical protein
MDGRDQGLWTLFACLGVGGWTWQQWLASREVDRTATSGAGMEMIIRSVNIPGWKIVGRNETHGGADVVGSCRPLIVIRRGRRAEGGGRKGLSRWDGRVIPGHDDEAHRSSHCLCDGNLRSTQGKVGRAVEVSYRRRQT